MSMMLGETTNNIIGTTTNPYNATLSAGGACGGEGALLALGGSRLGIGTDVAGSGRIPAAFCGLWSLKCSEGRLPGDGIGTVLSGLPIASGTIALFSSELDTLTSSFQSLVDFRHIGSDPDTLDMPWRQAHWDSIQRRRGYSMLKTGRLVFGIMANDGHVRPHPSIQRAIAKVTHCLEDAGHEVVTWGPPAHVPAVHTLFEIFGSTSAMEARNAIDASGEPCIPQIADWYQTQDMEPNSSAEFWQLCAELKSYRTRYKAYWNSSGGSTRSGRCPDGVILPVAATIAVRPGESQYYGYSAIANVLDYPSGVFPVTLGDSTLDTVPDDVQPLSDLDERVRQTCESENPVILLVYAHQFSHSSSCRHSWHARWTSINVSSSTGRDRSISYERCRQSVTTGRFLNLKRAIALDSSAY
jgi:amidase